MMRKKFEIAKLPELTTSVGMHGSARQKEVGGGACILVAVIMAAMCL
jgi:hypothetical protein